MPRTDTAHFILLGGLASMLISPGCSSGECDAYLDEPPGDPVTIRLKNDRADAIFLGSKLGCGDITPFTIRDANGETLPWQVSGCGFTCEDLQSSDGACATICMIPPVHRIEPGAHFDVEWRGTVVETVAMPSSCFEGDVGGSAAQCEREVKPAAGDYQITGEAFPTDEIMGDPMTATATLSYPGASLLEISFK